MYRSFEYELVAHFQCIALSMQTIHLIHFLMFALETSVNCFSLEDKSYEVPEFSILICFKAGPSS